MAHSKLGPTINSRLRTQTMKIFLLLAFGFLTGCGNNDSNNNAAPVPPQQQFGVQDAPSLVAVFDQNGLHPLTPKCCTAQFYQDDEIFEQPFQDLFLLDESGKIWGHVIGSP